MYVCLCLGDSEEEREDMELWADTCVELYQDNYDHLGENRSVVPMIYFSRPTVCFNNLFNFLL